VIENARYAFHTVCFSNQNCADTIITSERTEEGGGAGNAQDLAIARCDELGCLLMFSLPIQSFLMPIS